MLLHPRATQLWSNSFLHVRRFAPQSVHPPPTPIPTPPPSPWPPQWPHAPCALGRSVPGRRTPAVHHRPRSLTHRPLRVRPPPPPPRREPRGLMPGAFLRVEVGGWGGWWGPPFSSSRFQHPCYPSTSISIFPGGGEGGVVACPRHPVSFGYHRGAAEPSRNALPAAFPPPPVVPTAPHPVVAPEAQPRDVPPHGAGPGGPPPRPRRMSPATTNSIVR